MTEMGRKAAFRKGVSGGPLSAHCRHPARGLDWAVRSGDDPTGLRSVLLLLPPRCGVLPKTPHRER